MGRRSAPSPSRPAATGVCPAMRARTSGWQTWRRGACDDENDDSYGPSADMEGSLDNSVTGEEETTGDLLDTETLVESLLSQLRKEIIIQASIKKTTLSVHNNNSTSDLAKELRIGGVKWEDMGKLRPSWPAENRTRRWVYGKKQDGRSLSFAPSESL